jgi:predicted DNA-binding protein
MSKPQRKPVPYGAIALRAEVIAVLDEVAAKIGKTRDELAEEALLTYLEDLEDSIELEQAYKEWEKDGFKTYSLEDVLKENGLEG